MFSRLFAITLMIIALLGQSLSYAAMDCHGQMSESHAAHQMSDDVSNESDMSDCHGMMEASTTSSSADCCDVQCSCPASACSSISCLPDLALFNSNVLYGEKITSLGSNMVSPPVTNLYRPPIAA